MTLFGTRQFRLYFSHVLALFAPDHRPEIPDSYGIDAGTLEDWEDSDLQLMIDEGRRQLAALDDRLEHLRARGQGLFTLMLAFLAFAVGARFLADVASSKVAFALWYVGLALAILGLLGAAAVFATTAVMGSVDAVLLSHERPTDGIAGSLARAYPKAVKQSRLAVMARFTVMRDATWFSVLGAVLVAVAWGWLRLAR